MPVLLDIRLLLPLDEPPDGQGSEEDAVGGDEAHAGVHEARREVVAVRAQRAPSLLAAAQRLPPALLGGHVAIAQVVVQHAEAGGAGCEDALRRAVGSHGGKMEVPKLRSVWPGTEEWSGSWVVVVELSSDCEGSRILLGAALERCVVANQGGAAILIPESANADAAVSDGFWLQSGTVNVRCCWILCLDPTISIRPFTSEAATNNDA
jgi:hypothetical protein